MLRRLFGHKPVFGWAVPWVIVQDKQGNHYVPNDKSCYFSKAQGTIMVLVQWQDDNLVVHIHPDETCKVRTIDNLDGYQPVVMQIDKFMPSTRSVARNQTIKTSIWVGQYNSRLADYIIEQNLDKFDEG